MDGLHRDPDLDEPAEAMVHRAMEAVKKAFQEEFANDLEAPNITIVCSVPPDGRVGIATTEPTPEEALLALQMGWGTVHRAVRLGNVEI